MLAYKPTPIQEIRNEILDRSRVRLLVKREDLNHPYVSGNKWWKLKYNLSEARREGYKSILTFGGAYSNHIYATAAAASEYGFDSIGVIRGEETLPLNSTLSFARDRGMKVTYITRQEYKDKTDEAFLRTLKKRFGEFYFIPEGGTNKLAVRGIGEFGDLLRETSFDYLCVPVGTGGTLAGLVGGLEGKSTVIGYSVLKGSDFLFDEVRQILALSDFKDYGNWKLEIRYHQGGYGKITKQLLAFINEFETEQGFSLDPIYTGKMMWGIFEDIKKGHFAEGSTILAIHTGGLQGWGGFKTTG
ncbi:MAG TPA: pyridoxal-phosphate dependent enzyme [Cyclobacteriaceae bacterium]|nr:pyridoxal-phosphate dependent enzyme [Cyclobacteriaceae bacterium]